MLYRTYDDTATYLKGEMAKLDAAVAHILPPGFSPTVLVKEGEVHWFKIQARNNWPGYQLYPRRPERTDLYVVVMGGLTAMPGCCGSCVMTGITVSSNFQRKGLGTIMGKWLLSLTTRYSSVVGTYIKMDPHIRLARKIGFQPYDESVFKNKNTDNPVVYASITTNVYTPPA